MSQQKSLSKRFFLFLYVAMWAVILGGAGTWLTLYLVHTLGNPLAGRKAKAAGTETFDSLLALTEKKVVRYLGEWEFLEPKLPGHFHHIGRWYEPDKWNFCVGCHGPIPHSRSPRERAFLNMHNMFISCQTCHVQEQEGVMPTRFGWVDISTGQISPNPDMTQGYWGEYGAKIVPLTGPQDKPLPVNLDEEKAFAEEFRLRMNSLNNSQKVVGNKFIHRRLVENPVRCSNCHVKENVFLPYTDLGYSPERAAFLVSAEVVDLVQRYETFHMPNLLQPQEPEDRGAGQDNGEE
jgi:hypothetical protein